MHKHNNIMNALIRDTSDSISVLLLCDYIGNIYLKHCDTYYYISLSSEVDGIALVKIANPEYFKQHLQDNCHLAKTVTNRKIESGHETLRGKTMDHIERNKDNESNEPMDFTSYDDTFVEQKFYNIMYDEETDDDDTDDFSETYNLNGVNFSNYLVSSCTNSVYIADLLMFSSGSFDTIVINGNTLSSCVISTIERADKYCTQRLTIYTDGIFKVNLIGESIKYFKLVLDNSTLTTVNHTL